MYIHIHILIHTYIYIYINIPAAICTYVHSVTNATHAAGARRSAPLFCLILFLSKFVDLLRHNNVINNTYRLNHNQGTYKITISKHLCAVHPRLSLRNKTRVYMYIYIYVYTYMHTCYIYIYIHTYIHIHIIYAYVCINMSISICINIYIYIHRNRERERVR